jgi:hypothetical protein
VKIFTWGRMPAVDYTFANGDREAHPIGMQDWPTAMTHRERRGGFVLACVAAGIVVAAVGWLFGLALYDEAANWRRLLMEVWTGFSFGD